MKKKIISVISLLMSSTMLFACNDKATGTNMFEYEEAAGWFEKAYKMLKKEDYLAKKLSHGGKKFGLTDVELERMATIKIRTFGDLIMASDEVLTKVFGKKVFLAIHLLQVRDKIIERLADME